MPKIFSFLRCIADELGDKGLRFLAGMMPLGDHVYDFSAGVLKRWKEVKAKEGIASQDQQIDLLRRELEEIAEAQADCPSQFEKDVMDLTLEIIPNHPAQVRDAMASYLSWVPECIMHKFSRQDDPSGRTVPSGWTVRGSGDIGSLLPPRIPRFKAGDSPPNAHKWKLVERLGVGGFGEVWKAQHRDLPELITVFKFCLDPEAQELLIKHEAHVINQVMALVDHPGIVRLLGVDFSSDVPWLQYEFVSGGEMTELISELPRDPAKRVYMATHFIKALTRIVGFCHRLQPPVVHRDLKPANILCTMTPSGKIQLKVADFGIGGVLSHPPGNRDVVRQRPGQVSLSTPLLVRHAHTPMYASQQQKDGEMPDPRDDVYALGVLWYQFLFGNVGQRIGFDFREDLAELNLCDSVIGLLAQCVASRAERRPSDAAALFLLLETLPKTLLTNSSDRPTPVAEITDDLGAIEFPDMEPEFDAEKYQREEAERSVSFYLREIARLKSLINSNISLQSMVERSSYLRHEVTRQPEDWNDPVRKEYDPKLNKLKQETIALVDEIEIKASRQMIDDCLVAVIHTVSSVQSILSRVQKACDVLKTRGGMSPEVERKARAARERVVWYRAKRRLNEAEVVAASGNKAKAERMKNEARVLLAQDWITVFPDESPPKL